MNVETRPRLRGDRVQTALPSRAAAFACRTGGDIHARIELGLESLAANRPEEALAQFRAAALRSAAAAAHAAVLCPSAFKPSQVPRKRRPV